MIARSETTMIPRLDMGESILLVYRHLLAVLVRFKVRSITRDFLMTQLLIVLFIKL